VRGTTRTGRKLRIVLGLIVLVAAVAALTTILGLGPAPRVEVAQSPGIGPRTPLQVTVRESLRGLDEVRVGLMQGERRELIAEESFTSRPLWKLWGERTPERTLELEVGKEHQAWLVNGEAVLRVEATRPAGILRRGDPVVVEQTLPVRVTPPALHVLSSFTYAAQGGSEAVVYRVGPEAQRHGVQAGDNFFPGYPLPGQEGSYFSLFGISWDLDDADRIRLLAEDSLGNTARVGFVDRFTRRRPGSGKIPLSDPFMSKVVNELAGHSPIVGDTSDLLAAFLRINGELRRVNNQQLIDLGQQSRPEFLWRQHFLPFPSGQVMSAFASVRSYEYEGRHVDEQVHLGFDLASTQQAPVPAANDGIVMWAAYLGIYGNTVVLDHGYGLMSLYSHLSSFDVGEGDRVERGQPLGRTGVTGLSGGDHLHFATLMRGVPVTPVEWWDPKWIHDRLKLKLGDALPFGGPATAPVMRPATGGG
jgi:murein DD-endopeptidase MepM/ murein hydrolase activator NlpD